MNKGLYGLAFCGFFVAIAAGCGSSSSKSSGAAYCVEDGYTCTGIKEYTSCVNQCTKGCDDECSAYDKCFAKCTCDNQDTCGASCEESATADCTACLDEANGCLANCDEPVCTPKGGGTQDGGVQNDDDGGTGGGSGGCSELQACCAGLSGEDQTDCEVAYDVANGDEDSCAFYFDLFGC